MFRQLFRSLPRELAEAAVLDGATAMSFFWKIVLPLAKQTTAALFVVLFIYGWNQYLWPLLITQSRSLEVVVVGIQRLVPQSGTELPNWNVMMAAAMMALFPPIVLIVLMQRYLVQGILGSDK